ncbi:hypothetical protein pkur_cds_639 [Pandoravirus kuranda]|uniref:Uncharacterized protein n=1 Tax=Pandoravirus kuranda TaxID=3019033 RepID=A0AA95EF16_9VIRU|nr:hypothetical protein pkur_cds_639 [Pandoravirus kuranda]
MQGAVCDATGGASQCLDCALEWHDWVALADDRGLILRARDYPTLTPGEALLLVPIDMALSERLEEAACRTVPPREAATFFGPSIEVVVPAGRAWLLRDGFKVAVPLACLTSPWSVAPGKSLVQVEYYSLGWPSDGRAGGDNVVEALAKGSETGWSAEPGLPNAWLSNGDGDRWTRYMHWRDVLAMPAIRVDARAKGNSRNHSDGDDDDGDDNDAQEASGHNSVRGTRASSVGTTVDPAAPCAAVMAEVERILADAIARCPSSHGSPHRSGAPTKIVPVWLDDADAYLKDCAQRQRGAVCDQPRRDQ